MTGASKWWLAVAALSVLLLVADFVVMLVALALGEAVSSGVPSLTPLAGMSFCVVGASLVTRRPDNVVGRLLLAMGVVWAVGESAYSYLELERVGWVPGSDFVLWLNVWAFWPMLVLAASVVVLFPSGKVASTWMRWVLRIGVAVAMMGVAIRMILPVAPDQQTFGEEFANNPWAVESLASLTPVAEVADYLVILLLVLAMVDLVLRWRRSRGAERLQMRWLALGLVAFVVFLVAAVGANAADVAGSTMELLWNATWLLGLGALPMAVGVAVARYRLFEIDRLISRTLSYAVVAGLLVLVFFGVVTLLSSFLPRESDLATAGSTLAVATLFNPLRRRVQGWVDHRFNRSHFDAQRVADGFGETLRDEVDEGEILEGWVGVVSETMQPAAVGLWVRSGRGASP